MQIPLLGALASFLILTGTQAFAQECPPAVFSVATAAEATDTLFEWRNRGCLGRAECNGPLCRLLNPMLSSSPSTKDVQEGLAAVLKAAATLASGSSEGRTLADQMRQDVAFYADRAETVAGRWIEEDLRLFADDDYEINIRKGVLAECGAPLSCTARLAEARDILTTATLFQRVLHKANEERRGAFVRYLRQITAEWNAYLGSSRGQYPWELLLNSWRYRKTAAFDRAPRSQWVVAHPGAAFEVVRNGQDRNPSEVLLLELLGWHRWSWSDDGRMHRRFGGSLAVSWRDAGDNRRNAGFGALWYLPKGSTLGYVWRPQSGAVRDEHALLLSADIVKLFNNADAIKQRFVSGK